MSELYRSFELRALPIPRWVSDGDGWWSRDWSVTFSESCEEGIASTLQDALSCERIQVVPSLAADRRSARLHTRTRENPLGDYVFLISAYEMFRKLDRLVRISHIQDVPRAEWRGMRLPEDSAP